MNIILEAVLALLAAVGLFALGFLTLGRILCPVPDGRVKVVVAARGDGEDLEQTLRGLSWLRCAGLLRCPVVLSDQGLTPEGQTLVRTLEKREKVSFEVEPWTPWPKSKEP